MTRLRSWRDRVADLEPKTLAITLQVFFTLVVLALLLLLSLFHWELMRFPELLLGVGLLLVGTAWVVALKSDRVPSHLELALPLLDLVGLGLIRWATWPEGAQLSSLALAPALWLVVRYRGKGLLGGTLAVFLTMGVPSLFALDRVSPDDFARFALLPITFVFISALVLVLFDRLSHQHSQLKRQDRLLKAVINHLNVGVLVMDADGNDVMMNPAQQSIHGLVSPPGNTDPTESGHLLFDLQGESLPAEQRPARRVISGQTFDDVLVLAGPPSQEQRVLSITSRIIVTQEHGVESRILIFDDISEAYQTQRAQQDIIATVSHELRTPLTSILGYTDFAIETLSELPVEERAEFETFLTVIERNAEKLLARVEDLLLQQQARYGNLRLQKERISMSQLVQDAVEGQQAFARERGVSLDLEIADRSKIRADPQRMTQVVDNLISNALKYTPSGGNVVVRIDRADAPELATAEAVVSVTDTGPGLSTKDQEGVFTPFFRTESATKSAAGTGLGLSVSKGIVETHQGRIQVQSQPGKGSTFVVRLPLDEEYTS